MLSRQYLIEVQFTAAGAHTQTRRRLRGNLNITGGEGGGVASPLLLGTVSRDYLRESTTKQGFCSNNTGII
jgi:hypothetical protein